MKWFTLSGIKEEMKKITWESPVQLSKNTVTVFGFVLFFIAYFMLTEFVLVGALRWISIGV